MYMRETASAAWWRVAVVLLGAGAGRESCTVVVRRECPCREARRLLD